jgi:ketosteroid isomerase-like protein
LLEELRQFVLERVAAVRAKNPEPLAARQAPDVITFDVLPPLYSRGSGSIAERTQAW